MGWLDHVTAVPLIGVSTRQDFAQLLQRQSVLPSIVEALDAEANARVSGISIDHATESSIELSDGFHIHMTELGVVTSYRLRPRQTRQPGKLPTVAVDPLEPYTALLERMTRHVEVVLQALARPAPVAFPQIGIMARTMLSSKVLPPGVADWIETLARQWMKPLVACEGTFLTREDEGGEYFSQCHHRLKFERPEEASEYEVECTLDWQRVYRRPSGAATSPPVRDTVSDALAYFERFGEGALACPR